MGGSEVRLSIERFISSEWSDCYCSDIQTTRELAMDMRDHRRANITEAVREDWQMASDITKSTAQDG